MWILESDTALDGRRLWLRPGRTYLFGRTASEPGQLAISHTTISRKHLTIAVEPVPEGDALHPAKNSKAIIEDLKTKLGTFVDGKNIKGDRYIVEGDGALFTMGKCPSKFSLSWRPVGLTFSFTGKELRNKPYDTLRSRLEQLDIKLLPEYHIKWTTHVVSKKRNTAKGLQALINARHVVSESFLDAICLAAERIEDGPSLLEQDFIANWPDPMKHLPPKGGEPVEHPDAIYTPDPDRRNIFEGYTFIFYDKTQYGNLLAPVTSGGGKALMESVVPNSTTTDDFVRFVKSVAGEKGLGSFDDGSEGKGVVLVRYLPSTGDTVEWYKGFVTEVSLRLDHRPIEQSEFLEAILIKDASILRRPLEVESSENTQESLLRQDHPEERVQPQVNSGHSESHPQQTQAADSDLRARRSRTREPVRRRFAGFDDGEDISMVEAGPEISSVPVESQLPEGAEESGLFLSQEPSQPELQERHPPTRGSQRKRGAADPMPEDDLMDGLAPAAERFKRQRIARGENANSIPEASPESEPLVQKPQNKKIKKELDILAVAAKNREAEEARARQEKEDLSILPDDADLAEIRRLNIVEEMPVRAPHASRTREQDILDGRWDPRWNGMKNYKKFVPRGEQRGRPQVRTIVSLKEVKNKEFGVGDDYWLEDDNERRKKTQQQQTVSQPSPIEPPLLTSRVSSAPKGRAAKTIVSEESDSELEDVDDIVEKVNQVGRGAREASGASSQNANTRSQTSRNNTQSQGKRPAPNEVTEQPQPKRQRPAAAARKVVEVADSDDSDDELKFRFGKRRR